MKIYTTFGVIVMVAFNFSVLLSTPHQTNLFRACVILASIIIFFVYGFIDWFMIRSQIQKDLEGEL